MTDALPLWPDGIPASGIDPTCSDAERIAFVPTLEPVVVGSPGESRPAVVVLPGGGYHTHAAHECAPIARWLGGLGFATFVCRYRVAPHLHPAPLRDAERGIRIVRTRAHEWGVDPQRIGVLGFSAGGHCAATVSCFGQPGQPEHPDVIERVSGRPDATVLCYAVISFQPWGRHVGSMANLLGGNPDAALIRQLSLETAVTEQHPPTFLWSTVDDQVVSVFHSLHYAGALRRNNVPFAMHLYPNGPHGMGLAEQDSQVGGWKTACGDWFRSLGW